MKNLKWIIPIILVIAIVAGAIIYGVLNTKNTKNTENTQNSTLNQTENANLLATNETDGDKETNTNNNVETTGKTLIVYYSLTNRTEKVAQVIQEVTGGDLFRIETERSYPDAVMDVSAEARKERESGNLPALKGLPNIDDYDFIIVGGPVWSSTVSTPLMSFRKIDFEGKTVAPYWTDDSMPGHVETDFKEQAQNANILDGVGLSDVSEMSDTNKDEVTTWLNSIKKIVYNKDGKFL